MGHIPKTLKSVLAEAPLAWGIIALWDYRSRNRTAKQLIKEYKEYKKCQLT
jgi:hypothetical protein